jgi:hypothetical protein
MPDRKATIFVALALVLAAAYLAIASMPSAAERAARVARDDARKAGFKLDLSGFALSPEDAAHAATITNAAGAMLANGRLHDLAMSGVLGRLRARDAAIHADDPRLDDALRAVLDDHPIRLAMTVDERVTGSPLGSGPFGSGRLAQDSLHGLTLLDIQFFARAGRALRESRPDDAWTNLLAGNALVARFEPRPSAQFYLVRAMLMEVVFREAGELLRAHPWSDPQLAALERLWSETGFLRGLDEVPMYDCAEVLNASDRLRANIRSRRWFGRMLTRSFDQLANGMEAAWNELGGSLERRSALQEFARHMVPTNELLAFRYYSDRAAELRQVSASPDWRAMRQFSSVTNRTAVLFSNALVNRWPDRRIDEWNQGPKFAFSNVAVAESRRRLLLAILAVERAKLRLGRLPATLAEAGDVLPDFMTGEPFAYRPESDGTYQLDTAGESGAASD